MKLIQPTTFAPAMLISTTAVEAYSAYGAGTSYALAASVTYGGRIYESLAASNVGHQPDINPTWWLDTGPMNTLAMFDNQVSTSTTTTSTTLVVTVATGIIDSLYLGNVDATMVEVVVRDGLGGTIVYSASQDMAGETVGDWYQYFFFDPLILRTQALFTGIPPYASSHVTITLTKVGGTSVGVASFGRIKTLGLTQYGARAGIMDFSRKETDQYGNTTFVERAYSKRLSAQVEIENSQLNRTQRLLYDVRATPVVWIGSEIPTYDEALIVFGFYRDFSTDVAYYSSALCNLEIEGLI
jgi:hypothetical protein